MTLEELVEKIRIKAVNETGFHAKALFDFGDDGCIYVDATVIPPQILTDNKNDADVTLNTSINTFADVINGVSDASFAVLMGKIKINGSMELALQLNKLLD